MSDSTWQPPIPDRWYVFMVLVANTVIVSVHILDDRWFNAVVTAGLTGFLTWTAMSAPVFISRKWYGIMALLFGVATVFDILDFWKPKTNMAARWLALTGDLVMTVVSIIQRYGFPKPPPKLVRKVSWASVSE